MREIEDVKRYYAARAKDYDLSAGYTDPESEKARQRMKVGFRRSMKDRRVLEIACGTGYWTQVIAGSAKFVLATDISKAMVQQAKVRLRSFKNVEFIVTDAYTLEKVHGRFNAAFSHWFWSHIPKRRLRAFLENLHKRLVPGSLVLFSDHLFYESEGRRCTDAGDLIEPRVLPDGRSYLVVKNFPDWDEVRKVLHGLARDIRHKEFAEGYWTLSYRTKQ